MLKKIILISVFLISILSLCWARDSEFATNITSLQAYHLMKSEPNTYLIDVRTRFEYQDIGHAVGAYNFPYKFYTFELGIKDKNSKSTAYKKVANKDFIAELKKKFKPTDNLLIMCRSGHRSAEAIAELHKDGTFKKLYQVTDGFEGDKFHGLSKEEKDLASKYSSYNGHRSRTNGWRYYGLPETYSMDPKFLYPQDVEKVK